VMAVATVFAVNVSAATSGFALLARVVFAVAVGVVAFVGTTMVLGVREAGRTAEQRAGRGPGRGYVQAPEVPPDSPVAGSRDSPRERAASTSIRLVALDETRDAAFQQVAAPVTPDTGSGSPDLPSDQTSPPMFRGRLAQGSDGAPVRHLRPVPGGRGDPSPVPPGREGTADVGQVDEPGDDRPLEDEE